MKRLILALLALFMTNFVLAEFVFAEETLTNVPRFMIVRSPILLGRPKPTTIKPDQFYFESDNILEFKNFPQARIRKENSGCYISDASLFIQRPSRIAVGRALEVKSMRLNQMIDPNQTAPITAPLGYLNFELERFNFHIEDAEATAALTNLDSFLKQKYKLTANSKFYFLESSLELPINPAVKRTQLPFQPQGMTDEEWKRLSEPVSAIRFSLRCGFVSDLDAAIFLRNFFDNVGPLLPFEASDIP